MKMNAQQRHESTNKLEWEDWTAPGYSGVAAPENGVSIVEVGMAADASNKANRPANIITELEPKDWIASEGIDVTAPAKGVSIVEVGNPAGPKDNDGPDTSFTDEEWERWVNSINEVSEYWIAV